MRDEERRRLAEADGGARAWREWGPYLSERAWGTVREDYSEHGTAWHYFPHDHARSRAYRWNEDGMAGICDERQTFCFALALWNGRDPILKERMFGLGGDKGNHGEDAKDYWWYLDSTPTHSWMRWRYHYPQRTFPYNELDAVSYSRGRCDPEYELVDTGIFDEQRYWSVEVDYAKAGPTDLCVMITVENHGPELERLHVLPTLWFRNTWAWGLTGRGHVPSIYEADESSLVAEHRLLGRLLLSGEGASQALFCDNDTNGERLWGKPGRSPYPKDGINDHLIHGTDTVNPDRTGTKAALHHVLDVPAGGRVSIRLRLAQSDSHDDDPLPPMGLGDDFDAIMATRRAEADAYFDEACPDRATDEERMIIRQAVAGLMWSKQFYHFDVSQWLHGDPNSESPPEGRRYGRNSGWWHMNNCDVIAMPDPWEYPWYAAWDLAFHCVGLARVDPTFAKRQLLLLLREWYMHPNGQIPAYEWAFGDVNPPVHAWAALRVFELDGSRDYDFLQRVMHKLLLNFTWWVNRKDSNGNNVFEGGFLGLDNVGPFDRSAALPVAGLLEQSDGTAWMAMYALNLFDMALVLAIHDGVYEDLATKFFEHFAYIAEAAHRHGLWDDEDAFFYDVLRLHDGPTLPLKVRSVVGLLPLTAATVVGSGTLRRLPELANRMRWFMTNRPEYGDVVGSKRARGGQLFRLLSMVSTDHLVRILDRMLSDQEFLSPHGLRTLSRAHLENPYTICLEGTDFTVGYEPAESTSGVFGGNSNWRGPIWFPVNFIIIEALRRYGMFFGDDLQVRYPAPDGEFQSLDAIADHLSNRLVDLFRNGPDGRRPVFGEVELFQRDRVWHDLLPFYEYFNGDTGAGLGASHQTGWTALVAELIYGVHQNADQHPD
ncbi:MAG: glucosidase [Dactylosporangium sp.]|nr:glucosidase [Dactylosporangium sp.]NNJ59770.1 glucosidase [Dactylosporangium sp.]